MPTIWIHYLAHLDHTLPSFKSYSGPGSLQRAPFLLGPLYEWSLSSVVPQSPFLSLMLAAHGEISFRSFLVTFYGVYTGGQEHLTFSSFQEPGRDNNVTTVGDQCAPGCSCPSEVAPGKSLQGLHIERHLREEKGQIYSLAKPSDCTTRCPTPSSTWFPCGHMISASVILVRGRVISRKMAATAFRRSMLRIHQSEKPCARTGQSLEA